jgi:hypothetical protein
MGSGTNSGWPQTAAWNASETSSVTLSTRADLQRAGFKGFVSVAKLRADSLHDVPRDEGIYAVVGDGSPPRFLKASPAGRFKGQDPTVPTSLLRAKWVDGAELLYVGKAPRGASGHRGLAARLAELIAFGFGRPVGHWGGRYLWQLAGSRELEVAWLATATPVNLENQILTSFRASFGRYPFANIAGPRG